MNTLKTFVLMGVLTFILLLLGNAIGGQNGIFIALIMAGFMNFFSYWYSDKIVLSMYGAQPVDKNTHLYQLVEKLAKSADLPMPKVYIINEAQPNAFATGRNPKNAAVAVTRGLMDLVDDYELAGVIGHELGHVHNKDILISTVAATMAGAIAFLANMAKWAAIFGSHRDDEDGGSNPIALIGIAIFAPLAAMLVQMAISRTREYKADRFGAKVSGNPLYLANALRKLDMYSRRIPMPNAAPATENMFIVSPLAGSKMANLFSTHPSTEDRIRKLEEMRYE
ncbi:zinc metalloprotease HtpX [Fusobacterium sp. FSA-380-WT-2B]|uniref:zinc metalloprotease HtpX n=1 Tax=Fusobacterium sp. FSA-380-WT-2B TaxID=2605786 RepID=UPI0012B3A2E2|nr:zinc metalloprotease HtpX [Fusobacterium sp. FSA-380-WT-2B]MDY2801868.1 zinc metalloprotease HtpX [Fusobacterium mortiferum]MSS61103.1 zinc metalloprotease HtpX [Fusobacterium sp. FSA-380-WT-2B]